MISKLFRVCKSEGVRGLIKRLKYRLFYNKVSLFLLQNFGKKEVISSYGVLMTKNWLDATFIKCITGTYGNVFSSYLKNQTKPFVFFDIGANQGLYTLIACQNPNCKKVIAFEPVSSTFTLLKQNIKINDAEDKCLPLKKALGEEANSLTIRIPVNHSGAATTLDHLENTNKKHIEEIIEIESSDYLNELEISDNDNIICKIDVEGQEESVLKALARSQIFDKIQVLFYEIEEAWGDPKKIEYFLIGLGFQDFKKIGSGSHYDVLASRDQQTLKL
jgi:FkbM family methyltransferase